MQQIHSAKLSISNGRLICLKYYRPRKINNQNRLNLIIREIMSYYLYPLKAAALFFFVLIQFIAIPILASQYKKEGALTFTKGLVIYSFIFYLITAFFYDFTTLTITRICGFINICAYAVDSVYVCEGYYS